VYYVYKHLPILELHPLAGLASEAAECAGAQGAYWPMHDKLFAQPTEWSDSRDDALAAFHRYAEVLGLDAEEHARCIRDGDYVDVVRQDIAEAQALGLSGTPMFIINGKLLRGAHPSETFFNVLNEELAALSAE
jgi:Na+:H+ antiporter, NhaA family